MEILTSSEIVLVPNWAEKLANLTRIAWTGNDGICYFPYLPLTERYYWETQILADWKNENLFSWAMLHEGEIVAHAALVKKGTDYECGRWVALPDAPRGATNKLVEAAISFARKNNWNFWVECTQAHTSSQKICERNNLRFAGIGILAQINGIWWDIIYFDSQEPTQPFEAEQFIIAEPLGKKIPMREEFKERLGQIEPLISTVYGDQLPPVFFHILPNLEQKVRDILKLNL